jgi:hypothetical protein
MQDQLGLSTWPPKKKIAFFFQHLNIKQVSSTDVLM